MVEIRKTDIFAKWFKSLRDKQVKTRIQVRIDRLASGNPGQHRNLTGGVREMKIDIGPGYRVYFCQRGAILIVLLCGGDKKTQNADIAKAIELAVRLDEDDAT